VAFSPKDWSFELRQAVLSADNFFSLSVIFESWIPGFFSMNNQVSAKPSLTLPPAIFAAVAPESYFHAHLLLPKPVRANGRTPLLFRSPQFNLHSLTHANGSAIVRTGGTSVVCGVRAEILLAADVDTELKNRRDYHEDDDAEQDGGEDVIQRLGLLVPNVEMATGCAPGFLPGQAPSRESQTLSERLRLVLGDRDLLAADQFRIWEDLKTADSTESDSSDESMSSSSSSSERESKRLLRGLWTLYIDIVVISHDGNIFDAALASVMAALSSTLLPHAYWDADSESILCSPLRSLASVLRLNYLLFSTSFRVFSVTGDDFASRMKDADTTGRRSESWMIADPDLKEEDICSETLTVVLKGIDSEGDGIIAIIEKNGGAHISLEEMESMSQLAESRWRDWETGLKHALSSTQ